MIIYNKTWLANLELRGKANKVFSTGAIDQNERKAIYEHHPVGFYSPNTFIRIGLFVLTLVILSFGFGLLALLNLDSKNNWGIFVLFSAAVCYGALEFYVREKHHYRSGVDEALIWMSAVLLIGSVIAFYNHEPSFLMMAWLVLPIALFMTLRFVDTLMSVAAYLSLIAIIFFTWIKIGPVGVATAPFLMMGCTALIYFMMNKWRKKASAKFYHNCIDVIEVLALITFYAAGNYLVVRELSNNMFATDNANADIPYAWLFWAFTILIPFVYLYFGIKTKSRVLIRTCMLLFVCAIGTFRYYHSIMPMDKALILAGTVLLGIAFMITRYLKTPRNGFTTEELESNELMDKLQLESLIATEILPQQTPAPQKGFGGGDFGGGGSSSSY